MIRSYIFIFGMLFCLQANSQQKLVIDKVIAKVGGETILLSDVEAQFAFGKDQNPTLSDNELKCTILETLVGQKMIVHQAKLDSIEVSPDEIDSQLDFRIQSVLRQMNGDTEFFEEYYGMTVAEMRGNLREDLEKQILAERMQNKLLSEIDITPAEVEEFFNQIPADSIPYMNAEVEIGEIVVKPEINDEERTKALKQIIDIRKQIVEDSMDFAALAQKYSDDPGSGSRGGDLGFAARGTYVTEFEATAYSLDKNEISEPFESPFGYHIIQMLERRGNRIHVRHILVKPEITDQDMALTAAKLDTIKSQLERKELSFPQAVKNYSLEDLPSFHNNGRVQNPNTGKTFFQTSELSPEVYFATEEIDVGEFTPPLEYPQPTGETYYRLIQLQSRTKPHKASMDQDYTKIQQFAKESKKSIYFADWVKKKLSETFIDIDEDYITCPNIETILE